MLGTARNERKETWGREPHGAQLGIHTAKPVLSAKVT